MQRRAWVSGYIHNNSLTLVLPSYTLPGSLISEWNTVFTPHWVDGQMPLYPRDPDKLKAGLTVPAAAAMPDSGSELTEHFAEEKRLAHVVRRPLTVQ